MRFTGYFKWFLLTGTAALALNGCTSSGGAELPPASFVSMQEGPGEEYVIGPLDELTIFVWRNPELGARSRCGPTAGSPRR